ncbi:MAG: uroporphyrinogen decarboxylase family protein [Chloroflexota bacterium]
MLPKARTIAALEHRQPDRVPIGEQGVDWEVTDRALGVKTLYRAKWRTLTALWEGRRDEIAMSHARDLVGLTRKFDWDFVVVPMVPARRDSYPKPEMLGEYRWRDESGRVWHYSPESGGHPMVEEFPPCALDDLPDPSAPVSADESQFEAIEGVVKELGGTHFVFARVSDGTFPWEATVGMESYLMKMIEDPQFVHRAAAAYTARAIAEIKVAATLGVDGILTGTDYADNRAPLMGPRLFREFLLPHLKATAQAAHDAGLFFVKHTDGNLWSILDDFVDARVDGWQGIQPRIGMDLKLLKERYGDKLTFFGGVNCETLTLGTPEQVEEEVKYALRHATHGGGFALCSGNTLMPGTRYENYLAMVDANRKYGRYPIRV